MTETTQGGPARGALAETKNQPETPQVKRDPQTGINIDMPGDVQEAGGRPRGLTFGGPNHR
jgi:hypothetical protein